MEQINATPRTTLSRKPERGRADRALLHEIFDASLICHVGFIRDGHPVVIPTVHARKGDTLYLHGSTGSGWLNALKAGADVCVSATLIDALVLARSAAQHSANYRSAIAFGRAQEVTAPDEKLAALEALTEHVLQGRYPEVVPPGAKKLAATIVLKITLDETSVKVRTGPPIDDEEHYGLPIWAGEVPLTTTMGAPIADPRLQPDTPPSAALAKRRAGRTPEATAPDGQP